ncbi:MAG: helical backbone metal receptor [Chitinophagaceae bacterium]
MPVYTDKTANSITLATTPKRIISLVPSQTELLFDLGLDEEVVGITKFCVHPEQWFTNKIRVGGTKQLKMDIIRQLEPDLIIANKEENVKEQIEELQQHFPVWVSDVNDLGSAYEMIDKIGYLTGTSSRAIEIITGIKKGFSELQTINDKPQTIYLIWQDPYMTVGGDTFIHTMLDAAGLDNLYAGKTRYPEIEPVELLAMKPGLLLLSSEPYPFKQKHVDELQQLLPHTRIMLVDGELFSWYGSRLQYSPAYFSRLQAAFY